MTALEAAQQLRQRLNLPKDQLSIWLNRTPPIIKDRKILEKAKVTICVTFHPNIKSIPFLPPAISGYSVERKDIPWNPIEGQDLAIAEKSMMAKDDN